MKINRPLRYFLLLIMIRVKGLDDRVTQRDMFQRLADYYVENGAVLNVYMDYNAKGIRGLFASKAYEIGDFITIIPHNLTFICESHTDYNCIWEFAPVLTKHIETNGNTKWSHWLDTTPNLEWFEQTQIYFLPDEILKEFEPYLSIAKRERRLKKFFQARLPEHGEYAWYLIVSRSLHYDESDTTIRTNLVGIMDFINHDFDGKNTIEEFNGTHWILQATKPIAQGDELLTIYFTHENSADYVRSFGFYEENAKSKLSLLPKESCQQASRLFKKYNRIEYEKHRHQLRLLFKLYRERCGHFDTKVEL